MSETYTLGPAARALKAEIDGGTYVFPEYDESTLDYKDPDGIMESIRPRLYEVGSIIGGLVCNSLYDWAIETLPHLGRISLWTM